MKESLPTPVLSPTPGGWGRGRPRPRPLRCLPCPPRSRCACLGYCRVFEADITKYHRLGDFNHRHRFFHHPGGQKSGGSASSEGPEGRVRPGVSPWLAGGYGSSGPLPLMRVCIHTSPFQKDTGVIPDLGPTPLQHDLVLPRYLSNDPAST